MSWPQIWDENQDFVQKCGIHNYPTYLLLDPKGEIVFSESGWGDRSERELSARISAALRAARKANKS
jgi:L-rhamnose mutarotase